MGTMLESLNILKNQFSESEDTVKIIERELKLANEWVTESDSPEPKVSPRSFGAVTPSKDTTPELFLMILTMISW